MAAKKRDGREKITETQRDNLVRMYVYGTSTQTGLAQLYGLSTGYVSKVLTEAGAQEARQAYRAAIEADADERDYAEYVDLQREVLRVEREGASLVMRRCIDWITEAKKAEVKSREFERVYSILERCWDRLLARAGSGAAGSLPPIVMQWLPERARDQLADDGPSKES